MMIGRVWNGWATHANADAFEAHARNEFWPTIFARNIKGLREVQCLRLIRPGHTEFKMMMLFDSMDAVREFAGDDYTKAVIPPRAHELLRRYDTRAEHFEVREIRSPEGRATKPTQTAEARENKPAEPPVETIGPSKGRQARARQSV
jgi:hypothetical protein